LGRSVSPYEASAFIQDGMTVGTVGTTSSGCPAAVFSALAERAKREKPFQINLWASGPPGHGVDGILSERNLIKRRMGQQSNPILRKAVNQGRTSFCEQALGRFPDRIRAGFFGHMDIAVIEATAITEDGHIIPSTCVLEAPVYIDRADATIIEINTCCPLEMEGFHDIYVPKLPPFRKPIPISNTGDRIGRPYMEVEKDKVIAITTSHRPYTSGEPVYPDQESRAMAGHLIKFFHDEIVCHRLPENLLPIEVGLGATAEAILQSLAVSDFHNLDFYTAVLGDGILHLIDAGKVGAVSATGLYLSRKGYGDFFKKIREYRRKIVLRPLDIADSPEVIQRMGVIALNGAVEVDIYGHVNGTHVPEGVISGIGGGSDFANNSYLSIFLLPSTRRRGTVSTIVPMCFHVDYPEHAVDIVVTEQGLADLRGKDPLERAHLIVTQCAHPVFRPMLEAYVKKAIVHNGGHEPHVLEEALSFHGGMKGMGQETFSSSENRQEAHGPNPLP